MATGKGTVNKVILMGRLGADPELKYTPAGTAVATFRIATNQVWKSAEGSIQERTDWHRIVAWRKLAEIVGEWLKKGSYIYLEGILQTRSWNDKDGTKRYTTEVIADKIEFIGTKREDKAPEVTEPPLPAEFPEESLDSAPPEDDLPF